MGSFLSGKLYLEHDSVVAENRMAARIREDEELSYREWGGRVNEYLQHVDRLFSPDLIVLGGGVMEQRQLFPLIRQEVRELFNGYLQIPEIIEEDEQYIVPPHLGNRAGVLGAIALAQQAFI